ncbi:hypothetical protein HU200_015133 [Digitaria exilis]|uniref:Acid phosphatase n=1 Tax=Digitaria exilis TaxID=1010633 RepID=A0A835KJC5_9POAL|nr:hypothetical protein HU200_015133 [Digitaria exilis]
MARRGGGLVRLLVTLVLLMLAMLLAAAAAVAEATAPEVQVELAPAHNASDDASETEGAHQQQQQQPPPPQHHLLPRPLVIELPSSAPARSAAAGEGPQDDVPADAVVASREAEVVPTAPEQQQDHHLLPRPLAIDLPPALRNGGEAAAPDDVTADVRCASWRLAAEANNLAPWKSVPAECLAHVRGYVTGVAYRSDLELVARESAAYARAAPLRGDGRDAWVFDVDETLLSNLPYYADHGYGAASDREKTATVYKSEKRREMEEEGYRILGNSGDQWSDLLGSSMSVRSFKLPNPMYYIP